MCCGLTYLDASFSKGYGGHSGITAARAGSAKQEFDLAVLDATTIACLAIGLLFDPRRATLSSSTPMAF
jgi:hypothetical protein